MSMGRKQSQGFVTSQRSAAKMKMCVVFVYFPKIWSCSPCCYHLNIVVISCSWQFIQRSSVFWFELTDSRSSSTGFIVFQKCERVQIQHFATQKSQYILHQFCSKNLLTHKTHFSIYPEWSTASAPFLVTRLWGRGDINLCPSHQA